MELVLHLDARELQAASELTGITDPAKLIQYVLREYLHARASAELPALSGTDPQASAAPRRRPPDFLRRDRSGSVLSPRARRHQCVDRVRAIRGSRAGNVA
jgi:hypothetical protein